MALSLLSVRDSIKYLVAGLLLFSLSTFVSAQDIPLEVQETFYGNYRQAMHGVSLYQDFSSGTFDIDIPSCASGAPQIEHAYFIWQQRWRNSSGSSSVPVFDDNFEVTVGGNPQFTVDADETFIAMNPADPGQTTHLFTGYTDVTTIISGQLAVGTNTIQIDNLVSPTPGGSLDENWGVGLIVIYECPEFDEVTIQTSIGSDFFLCQRDGVAGDYSHISCFEFSMPLMTDIDATITGMFGGQANATAPFRGGNICYLTGSGTLPGNSGTNVAPSGDVVTDMDAVCSDNPTWTSSLGTEWDEFDIDITIPSGSAWICLQSHSVRGPNSARCGSLAAATYSILYETDVFNQGTPVPCTNPSITAYALGASCTNGTPNDDGYLQISAASNATHYDFSVGSSYTGTGFGSAIAFDPATDLPLQFGTLANPTGAQAYTIRVFNGDNACFTDITVSLNEQDCDTGCDCTEYIYLNEPSIGSVLKFEIDPNTILLNEIVQVNEGTPPNEHWYPGLGTSELPSPHGFAYDLNGNAYIGETGSNSQIRQFNCTGEITPANDFALSTLGYSSQNIFTIGNTLFINSSGGPTSFDICSSTNLGQACLNNSLGNPTPTTPLNSTTNLWGLSFNENTGKIYASGRLNTNRSVWSLTVSEYNNSVNTGTCIDPLISLGTSPSVAVGENYLPSDASAIFGIVADNSGNMYVVVNGPGGEFSNSRIFKYDQNGGFLAASTFIAEASAMIGIVWSIETNRLYVSSLSDDPSVNCISAFDANDLSYIGTAAPNPNLPVNNTAKAIAIGVECCPSNNRQTIDQIYCVAGNNEKLFLNQLFPCTEGVICEAQWTPVDAASTNVFESCDQSIQENLAPGCYGFTRSSDGLSGKLCGAFEQSFNIEIIDLGNITVSADQNICEGTSPTALTVTAAMGSIQWQMSTTSCTTGFTDITMANAMTYQPSNLTETTYYRAIITAMGNCTSGNCSYTSDCITVNVNANPIVNLSMEACDDNTTVSDDADDYITFSLNPTGPDLGATYSLTVNNGGTVSLANGGVATNVSYGGQTDFRLQSGSADGMTSYTVTLTDSGTTGCTSTFSLSQSSCSDVCNLIDTGISMEDCNDNGTNSDASDDYIIFSLNPSGLNLGTTYSVSVNNGGAVTVVGGSNASGISYGAVTAFRLQSGSADGSTTYTITITDDTNGTCQITTNVMQSSCSTTCSLTDAGESSETCNDNSTPSDASDDFITFSLNPSGLNLGTTYSVSANNGGVITVVGGSNASGISYGAVTAFRLQSGSADGSTTYTITITDDTNGTCQITTNVMQNSCSTTCSLTDAGESSETCNDNSTPSDASDDFITFSLNPMGFNLGTTYSLTVNNGGIVTTVAGGAATGISYGNATEFRLEDGSADGATNYTITIMDDADATCQITTMVMHASCSDVCSLTDAGESLETCNNNGTISNASDDYITFNLNPSGLNLGNTYTVAASNGGIVTLLAGGAAMGIAYGNTTAFRLQDGSADGTTNYTITITDDSDSNCQMTTMVMQDNCAIPCPTISNASSNQSICTGQTITQLSIDTDLVSPDLIDFVYFTNQQTGNAMYAGGTSLGTVSPTASSASISNVGFPAPGTYYVYAIISPAPMDADCRPFQEMLITVNPIPDLDLMVDNPMICDGDEAPIIVLNSEVGVTYQLRDNITNLAVGSSVIGTGGDITLPVAGLSTGSYTYNILASIGVTGCQGELTNTATVVVNNCDFPDFPPPTCVTPACHIIPITPLVYFGNGVTADTPGNGDTNADTDIDDGIGFPNDIRRNMDIRLPITFFNNTGNPVYIQGWIDWDGDTNFDAEEQVADLLIPFDGTNLNQIISHIVRVPADAVQDNAVAMRWRISSDPIIIGAPCGIAICASDGEVEDYLIQVECPLNPCLPTQIQILRGE